MSGRALWIPDTAVVDPKQVLLSLAQELRTADVDIEFGAAARSIDEKHTTIRTDRATYGFGHFINAAGLHADTLAHRCGVAEQYRIVPFKGIYHALSPTATVRVHRLIYPVPDLRVPFLGVHFTPSVSGRVYVGPTAIPAFGRENYRGLHGLAAADVFAIARTMTHMLRRNEQGFRRLVVREMANLFGGSIIRSARRLVPDLRAGDVVPSDKVGIRAQLVDIRTHTLIMDYVVEHSARCTHVLNAVSPAFTSAFGFARSVVNQLP